MSEPPPPPAGYQPPQPYASAPYGTTPYGAPLVPRTNTLAIVALVLSLTVSLGGIICGHIALSQIKRTGESGRGLALAGLIIGYIATAFWVIYFAIVIAAVIFSISMAGTYGTYS